MAPPLRIFSSASSFSITGTVQIPPAARAHVDSFIIHERSCENFPLSGQRPPSASKALR
jgi:hypothetical protein